MNSKQSFHRIKKLKVTGGFLVGVEISFADGLNCLIGPRGTGKSSVQELIRYALNVMPGREGDPLRKRTQALIDNNLNGGRVELTIETKDGFAYTVSRAAGEDPILLNEAGNPLPVDPMSAQLFRADIYSQNQIENIAETPHYQLDLLDKFDEEKLRAVRVQIAGTVRQLQSNTTAIQPLIIEKATLEGELTQLEGVRERLKGFAKNEGQDAEALNRAHALKALRDREIRALDHASGSMSDFAGKLRTFVGAYESHATSYLAPDMLTGPNGVAATAAAEIIRKAIKAAEAHVTAAFETLDQAGLRLSGQRKQVEQQHVAQEMEFRKLVEQQQQNQAQSAERAKVEKQQNDLIFKKGKLDEVNQQLKTLTQQRDHLLAKLSDERDRRFGIRNSVATMLNKELMPYIRVTVAQNADQEAFRKSLEITLRDARIQHRSVAAALSGSMSPQELCELVRHGDVGLVAKKGGINPQQAVAVLKALATPEKFMELETVDMDDLPCIELLDNDVYKSSADISTGQKCTAILPILMFDSANPLLIDQPEDNLDNRFVYQSIVASVNKAKDTRQLIFVTHNPNIPVLGDAAQIVVMQSDGRTGRPKLVGKVDDCREEIINLLEGGAEAFRLRRERYESVQNEW